MRFRAMTGEADRLSSYPWSVTSIWHGHGGPVQPVDEEEDPRRKY